jgi:AcrR family transcriptional regulator
VLQAALAILARDGPARLTLDAIAAESGISKGGLMHQFRSKEAVLKALLEHQVAHYEAFAQGYTAPETEPCLATQIATVREAVSQPLSVAFALMGAVAQDPGLLTGVRQAAAENVARMTAEAADPDLALLRWAAARGLLLTALQGICPLSAEERERLFARLLDPKAWTALEKPRRRRAKTAPDGA